MQSNRGFLITLIIAGGLLALGFYMHWLRVRASEDRENDKYDIELSINKGKAKQDAIEAKEKVADKVEAVGQALKPNPATPDSTAAPQTGPNDSIVQLTLEHYSIQMVVGTRQTLKATRFGGDMGVLQIGLRPSQGSNLLALGGLFKPGDTETTITIDAPHNARDGSITILVGDKVQELKVNVVP